MTRAGYRFVDTGTAPEIFATGLHDVQVMGPVSRFVLYTLRMVPNGTEMLRESVATVIMPNEAIGPAIALTLKKMPSGLIVPAFSGLARHFFQTPH